MQFNSSGEFFSAISSLLRVTALANFCKLPGDSRVLSHIGHFHSKKQPSNDNGPPDALALAAGRPFLESVHCKHLEKSFHNKEALRAGKSKSLPYPLLPGRHAFPGKAVLKKLMP